VIGTNPKTDLALLKVTEKGEYPFVSFAKDAPKVGDWVVAIGNPFGLGNTVTAGIVSADGRDIGEGPYDSFLQIDAPINEGNSGGPTFNLKGEVVGVNTAIFSPSEGSVGVGFAIPARTVEAVVDSLKHDGVVSRGFLGIRVQPVSEDIAEALGLKTAAGSLIDQVEPGTPAADAGLKSGDVITKVNGQAIKTPQTLLVESRLSHRATRWRFLIFATARRRPLTLHSARHSARKKVRRPPARRAPRRMAAPGSVSRWFRRRKCQAPWLRDRSAIFCAPYAVLTHGAHVAEVTG
jgi:S1-C subfamily serine protease